MLGRPGDWRMIATTPTDNPRRRSTTNDSNGTLEADSIVVLAPTVASVSAVIKVHGPELVVVFDYPDALAH